VKAAVINVSGKYYNLGCAKLANWLRRNGYEVECFAGDPHGVLLPSYDLVCLSVIFSWHLPLAAELAMRCGSAEVWCGGPGVFRRQDWWRKETGRDVVQGQPDYARFEYERGDYRMAFASRGCPENCHFCIVTPMEGADFTMDWDFQPAPILCDNNLSALPVDFQNHIIRRYQETGVQLLDANSGFEPGDFDAATFERWRPILRGPWRYAFDILPEWRAVKEVCDILKGVNSRKKRVYCLVGNEPIEVCHERALKILEWGAEPHCQYEVPLDTLTMEPTVRHDWTAQKLHDFCRFFNRWFFRKYKLHEYKPRQNEPNPFMQVAPALRMIT
jgi:hypothetical protein